MNKSTQMKIRVLKKARAIIRSDEESFVCFALDNVMTEAHQNISQDENREMFWAAKELSSEIRRILVDAGLGVYGTVGSWLVYKGVLTPDELEKTSKTTMRRYRVAWLTSWIDDLSKEV